MDPSTGSVAPPIYPSMESILTAFQLVSTSPVHIMVSLSPDTHDRCCKSLVQTLRVASYVVRPRLSSTRSDLSFRGIIPRNSAMRALLFPNPSCIVPSLRSLRIRSRPRTPIKGCRYLGWCTSRQSIVIFQLAKYDISIQMQAALSTGSMALDVFMLNLFI